MKEEKMKTTHAATDAFLTKKKKTLIFAECFLFVWNACVCCRNKSLNATLFKNVAVVVFAAAIKCCLNSWQFLCRRNQAKISNNFYRILNLSFEFFFSFLFCMPYHVAEKKMLLTMLNVTQMMMTMMMRRMTCLL